MYSEEMNKLKDFNGFNGVALGVQTGSYCSYVQYFINKKLNDTIR